MNIKLGWSGDIHGTWTKMDVEVDESDFQLHFAESNIGDVSKLSITSMEKFRLMFVMAEIFVALHKASKFPEYFNKADDKTALRNLIESRNKITEEVIKRTDKAPF